MTISGAITKRVETARAGTVALSGVVTKQVQRRLAGNVTAQGVLNTFLAGAVALYAEAMALLRSRVPLGMTRRWQVLDFRQSQVVKLVRRWAAMDFRRRQG